MVNSADLGSQSPISSLNSRASEKSEVMSTIRETSQFLIPRPSKDEAKNVRQKSHACELDRWQTQTGQNNPHVGDLPRSNIESAQRTSPTFHVDKSPSNNTASLNVPRMLTTDEVSQSKLTLNLRAPSKAESSRTTRETSQSPISRLNREAPLNIAVISITEKTNKAVSSTVSLGSAE